MEVAANGMRLLGPGVAQSGNRKMEEREGLGEGGT
jgi:hypothetical protein